MVFFILLDFCFYFGNLFYVHEMDDLYCFQTVKNREREREREKRAYVFISTKGKKCHLFTYLILFPGIVKFCANLFYVHEMDDLYCFQTVKNREREREREKRAYVFISTKGKKCHLFTYLILFPGIVKFCANFFYLHKVQKM